MKRFFKRPRDCIKRNAETIALAAFLTLALTETCYATLEQTTTGLQQVLEGNIATIVIMGGLIFGVSKALFSGNIMLAVAVVACVILFVIAKGFLVKGFVLFGA
jgi:hypothetical protein